MSLTTLCYVEQDDKYLMLHRIKKQHDINKEKWIGIGGHFEENESPEECLLREAMAELKSQGYKAAHILVAKDNVKALRSYEKLHFTTAGECELFGHSYWCYEKEL